MKRLTTVLALSAVLWAASPVIAQSGGGPEQPPAPSGGGPEQPPAPTASATTASVLVDLLTLVITVKP